MATGLERTAISPMTGQPGQPLPQRPSLAQTALSPLMRAYQAYQQYVGQPFQQAVRGGVRGYFGLPLMSDASALGREAYGQGVALSNVPGVGAPAGAAKVAAQALGALPEAAMFIGALAKTWDAASNAKAVEMEARGVDPRTIWRETGNWRGPDGKWRQEISDEAAKLTGAKGATKFGEALQHPELFKAYPDLRSIQLAESSSPYSTASYTPAIGPFPEEISLGGRPTETSALHEAQHPIQEREGFIPGSSSDVFELKFKDTPEQRDAFNVFANISEKLGGPKDLRPSDLVNAGDVEGFIEDIFREINVDKRLSKDDWRDLRQSLKSIGIEAAEDDMLSLPSLVEQAANILRYETNKNVITPMSQYIRTAGEAEARATEARRKLTQQQRRALFPEESYDVPINELIGR